ncbi:hypothetical protein cypCar_00046886 [Cyprinus carpio]|nr:hypothetical protein cypCar_00046886 [Cyprinus carpio]
MSETEAGNTGEIHPEAGFDNTNTFRVSVQYVDDQEAISEDTFEDNNILISPTVKLSVQCMENQRGLHGQIVYDDVSYPIHLQPQAEPDDDEGVVIDTEEDKGLCAFDVNCII